MTAGDYNFNAGCQAAADTAAAFGEARPSAPAEDKVGRGTGWGRLPGFGRPRRLAPGAGLAAAQVQRSADPRGAPSLWAVCLHDVPGNLLT